MDAIPGESGRARRAAQYFINGGAGDDALAAGYGQDRLDGGTGYDVCLVEPHDTAMNCEEIHHLV